MSTYTKTTWVEGVTPWSVANFNNLESQHEKILDILTTRGDMVFRNATTWQRLAKGNSGDVLTMGANDPAWVAPYLGPSTQSDVTASRAIGTNYQNTTGKPMYITMTFNTYEYNQVFSGVRVYSDSTSTPSTMLARLKPTGGANVAVSDTVTIVVLPNNYYRVDLYEGNTPSSHASIVTWIESY